MYCPHHFAVDQPAALHGLMRAHPLADLVRTDARGELTADAVPLLLDTEAGPQGELVGHVARANPLWREADGRPVLAIFRGPQGHVSPSWYPSKARDARVVPTWNYSLVHAHGTLEAIDDRAWLRKLLHRLTTQHERAVPNPWAMDDAPADFLDRMLGAVVGLRIRIARLEGKFKLSQNRPAEDRAGVVAALRAAGQPALADAVNAAAPPPDAPAP